MTMPPEGPDEAGELEPALSVSETDPFATLDPPPVARGTRADGTRDESPALDVTALLHRADRIHEALPQQSVPAEIRDLYDGIVAQLHVVSRIQSRPGEPKTGSIFNRLFHGGCHHEGERLAAAWAAVYSVVAGADHVGRDGEIFGATILDFATRGAQASSDLNEAMGLAELPLSDPLFDEAWILRLELYSDLYAQMLQQLERRLSPAGWRALWGFLVGIDALP